MIRYSISYDDLETKITTHKRSWLRRATERTDKLRIKGTYEEASTIWSEIKAVYVTLQHHKCVFCERQLEDVDIGLIEQDVEHFRPKGNVKPWQSSHQQIIFSNPPPETGYYLLAYHLFNYAASCKPCNSTLKKDIFPIAAQYDFKGESPAQLNDTELPYLIYPIGSIDEDPEQLIGFNGLSPFALATDQHRKNRALVTIELFLLDDAIKRKVLYKQRAMVIQVLWAMLEIGEQSLVTAYTADSAPHANCARCFEKLYRQNKSQAERYYRGSIALVQSHS